MLVIYFKLSLRSHKGNPACRKALSLHIIYSPQAGVQTSCPLTTIIADEWNLIVSRIMVNIMLGHYTEDIMLTALGGQEVPNMLHQDTCLEEKMAAHSGILAWEIP